VLLKRISIFRYAIFYDGQCNCGNILKESEVEVTECARRCDNGDEQVYCGGVDTESFYNSGSNLPGPVGNLKFSNRTEDKITITFDPPERNGTELTGYDIRATVLKTFSTHPWLLNNQTWKAERNIQKFDLTNLISATSYNISITAKNGDSDGGSLSLTQSTKLGPPDKPESPKFLENANDKVRIEIKRAANNNGPVSSYLVVVHFVDNELLIHDFDVSLLSTYQRAQDDGLSYYITGEVDAFKEDTKIFVIGDGKNYGKFFNAPLSANRHFHILVGVVSRWNNEEQITYSDSSHDDDAAHQSNTQTVINEIESKGDILIVILTIACILCGLVLVVAIVFYGYIKTRINPRNVRLERHMEMSLQGPILEVDNNGFISDISGANFKEKLTEVLYGLDDDQKIVRKNLSLDIDNIIGMGVFGDVIKGQLNGNVPCQVHVVSSDDMDPPVQVKFIRDLNMLLQFGFHKGMLNFMGICQTHDWFFVVFEDTPATLKQFLLSNRSQDINPHNQRLTSLSEEQILKLMFELAETVEYLAFNKIVHKNLNSYNVRIKRQNSAYTIKLTTFGPTLYSAIEEGSKHMIDDDRWFAPEVMRYQKYSHASDIYSLGLVLWEMCCLGATCYSSIPTSDLLTRIKKGIRPEKTPFIYEDLYQLLLNCWELDPNERSTLDEIVGQLKQLTTSPEYALNYNCNTQLPYFLPLLEVKN